MTANLRLIGSLAFLLVSIQYPWSPAAGATQNSQSKSSVEPQPQQQKMQVTAAIFTATARELVGKTVLNSERQELGRVKRMLLNRKDHTPYALTALTGTLAEAAIPLNSLALEDGALVMYSGWTTPEIEQENPYDPEKFMSLDPHVRIGELDSVQLEPQPAAREFARLDTNHDGYISRKEARQSSNLTNDWNNADSNHDDQIDLAEFAVFERQYEKVPQLRFKGIPEP